jgi:hypothetical protein
MKHLKRFILATLAALALSALAGASTASATTLEIGGVAQNSSVTIEATVAAGGSVLLTDTSGVPGNTCTTSTVEGATVALFTAAAVNANVNVLAWAGCGEGNPVTDAAGTLSVEHIAGTTNGTLRSTGAKVTVPSLFGTLTCTTNNTDLGTITGVAAGHATMDINAVLSCTIIASARLTGTYTVTGPTGLGVV